MQLIKLMLAALLLLAASAGASVEAGHGTPEQAMALVKKAAAYLKANGREKAFAEYANPKGPFIARDLYIFVLDANVVMLAHGVNPRMVGKSLIEVKDAEGKPFAKAFQAVGAGRGSGWVDYKWPNPVTGAIEQKSTYIEQVGDVLIGCGVYK